MPEIKTTSGASVVINIAPWEDAKRLKKAIERELANAGIKLNMQSDVSELFSALLRVDSSDDVDAALWPCLARCTRDGSKIIPAMFDTADGRADYYEIVTACIQENLRPLVESLYSKLPASVKAMLQKSQNIQKQS